MAKVDFESVEYNFDFKILWSKGFDKLVNNVPCKFNQLCDLFFSYSLTLIDALDTLAVMGNKTEFQRVAHLITQKANFDVDINVSVFETNIRIVGGLLSAHLMSRKWVAFALVEVVYSLHYLFSYYYSSLFVEMCLSCYSTAFALWNHQKKINNHNLFKQIL